MTKGMDPVCRIVLVDDDPISHLISSRIIGNFSCCSVEAFTDPVEALRQLQRRASQDPDAFPDCILLDIDMPMMDGWEFLSHFQQFPTSILEKTSVIMLSSSGLAADKEKARTFDVVKNYFTKPLTEQNVNFILTKLHR